MVIPYLASSRWYAYWTEALMNGISADEAIAAANRKAGMNGKDFSRCVVEGNNGVITLSVAVEGGAHRLKNRNALQSASVSDHGNWQHVHLGALEASYGRTPFYQHFAPDLKDIISNYPSSLLKLNSSLHDAVVRFLGLNELNENTINIVKYDNSHVAERGIEIASMIRQELSIVDPIMKYGKEVLLGLIYLDTKQ